MELENGLTIREDKLFFKASPSRGPGGQHVNRASTRVELLFNVETSGSLDAEQKRRIQQKLASRISKGGLLRVSSGRFRSQLANKKAAMERFQVLLGEALLEEKPRRTSRVSRSQKRARLEAKSRRGALKRQRSKPLESED